jgi:hypothetical protein
MTVPFLFFLFELFAARRIWLVEPFWKQLGKEFEREVQYGGLATERGLATEQTLNLTAHSRNW